MIHIEKVAHHRNGITGVPFYVVLFKDNRQRMLATVFDDPDVYVAVFDRDLLAQDVIEFGRNSWYPEHYDRELRAACAQWEANDRPATGVNPQPAPLTSA